MRYFLWLFTLIFFLTLYSLYFAPISAVSWYFISPCYAEEGASYLEEAPQLHFDERDWQVGYEASNEQQAIVEYVLKGETVHNWSELVTLQTYFGLQKITTPEVFVMSMKKNMKPSLQWNIISKSDNDILYEWNVMNDPEMANQHEIARGILGKKAIYFIRYTTKKPPIPLEKRNEWIDLLKAVVLKVEGGKEKDLKTASSEKESTPLEKGDYDEAIAKHTKAIQENPKKALNYYNRALAYRQKDKLDEAISDYSKAIEIKPDYAKAYNNRGFAYALIGYKFDPEFIEELKKASSKDGAAMNTLDTKAILYNPFGNVTCAQSNCLAMGGR